MSRLTSLDMCGQNFGVAGAEALVDTLSQLVELRQLSFGQKRLGQARAATRISPALRCLTNLTSLNLHCDKQLQLPACEAYAPSIAALPQLQELQVGCNICAEGIEVLIKHLSKLTALTSCKVDGAIANPPACRGEFDLVTQLRQACHVHGASTRGVVAALE